MVAITLSAWLSVIVGGLLIAHVARRRARLTAALAEIDRPRVPSHSTKDRHISGTAQVLFVETAHDVTVVDCALVGDDVEGASPGSLLSLSLLPADHPVLEGSLEALVERWAREGAVVGVDLRSTRHGWRADFDDGSVRLRLRLAETSLPSRLVRHPAIEE